MNSSKRRSFDVRIHGSCVACVDPSAFVGWFDAGPPTPANELAIDEWLAPIVPTWDLCRWCTRNSGWYDFERRYLLELAGKSVCCERLAVAARSRGLWLAVGASEAMQRGVRALKTHLELMEARRRYRAGWIVGGLTWHLRDEILRHGGLWLSRHKAWTLPDRDSWQAIQRMLPGDF